MGIIGDIERDMQNLKSDKAALQKAEHYADLNKDGKVDGKDLATVKQYESKLQNVTNKFDKKK